VAHNQKKQAGRALLLALEDAQRAFLIETTSLDQSKRYLINSACVALFRATAKIKSSFKLPKKKLSTAEMREPK